MVKYVYDAWGNHAVLDSEGHDIRNDSHIGILNPFRYRGYFYDTETGLYYLQTRYYDPETGRFISQDSIEYAAPETINGLNLYAYCGSNPIMYVDPTGCLKWWEWLGIAFAVVGAALVIAAVSVLTFGVGTAIAGTMTAAVIYGAAQGILIGAAVGAVVGGVIGGAVSGWSLSGILSGIGIGLGVGAIIGGIIGGFAGASSFSANSAFISQNGGNVKEVLSAYKGNPKLKTLKADTTVFRTWGGESLEYSHWVSPKDYGINVRAKLSLPPKNTAEYTSIFNIPQNTIVLQGRAAAMFNQVGGGIQWWVAWLM